MKVIKFAKDYPKLQEILFSTIRTTPKKINPGQPCQIKSPSMEFRAALAKKYTKKLSEIDTNELIQDTNTHSRDEALAELREYYPDLEESDEVQILWFVKDGRD